jgi:acyl transferase domain-containing protein
MEKIAVIGMSCLFPGADTREGFWRNLMEGRDSRTRVTDERLGLPVKEFYDPQKSRPDTFYYGWGGYVDDFEMDPTGFQIRPEVILASDDIVQWSLHVAREALKDSGHWGNGDALANCGVILGNLSVPTRSSSRLFSSIYYQAVESCVRRLLLDEGFCLAPASSLGDPSSNGGRVSGYPADVVAKALALSGPHFALDAACASSLYAVKFACETLLTRKADLMLAGAVNASDRLNGHVGFSILQTYPEATEKSVPLDKDSKGLVLGEGAGMFVLKRYHDAVRDGDRVHAVIRGTGLSNDGRGQSVLSPNSKGQVLAFERA